MRFSKQMWDEYHKKRTLNGTVPGARVSPLYSLSSKKPPTVDQWREWWNYADWNDTVSSYMSPNFTREYFGELLSGWYKYGTPEQKQRIAAFRRHLARNKSAHLSRKEWDELRRQIFYSY